MSTPGHKLSKNGRKVTILGHNNTSLYPQSLQAADMTEHDLNIIYSRANQSNYAHTPKLPEFNGPNEAFSTFYRDFMAMVDTIPNKMRLLSLRTCLRRTEDKNLIEEFEETDDRTFEAALRVLRAEYLDPEDMFQNLVNNVSRLVSETSRSDSDFVTRFDKLTVCLKRLGKLDANRMSVALDPLAVNWLTNVPDSIFNRVRAKIGAERRWLTFFKLYNLIEEYVQGLKRTCHVSSNRQRLQRSANRMGVHSVEKLEPNSDSLGLGDASPISSTLLDETIQVSRDSGNINSSGLSSQDSTDPYYEAYFLNKTKYASHPCCFCKAQGDGHLSLHCQSNMNTKDRRNLLYKEGRCFLCCEPHKVNNCPLSKNNIEVSFRCKKCSDTRPHAGMVCVNKPDEK